MTDIDISRSTDPTVASAPWPVERLVPTFAAQVYDVDLREVAEAGMAPQLYSLLVEHKVLFFRDQQLDPASQAALGQAIGELTVSHPVATGAGPDHPEIYEVDSFDGGRSDVWHTDVTFMPRPPMASILRAVTLPEVGGNTNWVDLEAAYASLSPAVRRLADELVAEHDGSREWAEYLEKRRGGEGNEWDGEQVRQLKPVPHPVVRVHPDTGRRSLFVNPGFTTRIRDVSDAESRGLLDAFFAHVSKPEHLVRHRWQPGDVVVWDNRSTAHYADFNYGNTRRVMHRITVRGDIPVGPR